METINKLPTKLAVALSGGVDSLAIAQLLINKDYDITLLHYVHNSEIAKYEEELVLDYAYKNKLELIVGRQIEEKPKGDSPEEYWRNGRYSFFDKYDGDIILGHTLDDVVETWLFSCLHCNPKLIPYRRNNCIRPFLLTRKEELIAFAKKSNLVWYEDPTNVNTSIPRNNIRHNLIPEVLKVNQGIFNTVRKSMLKKILKENMTTRQFVY